MIYAVLPPGTLNAWLDAHSGLIAKALDSTEDRDVLQDAALVASLEHAEKFTVTWMMKAKEKGHVIAVRKNGELVRLVHKGGARRNKGWSWRIVRPEKATCI